MKIKEITRSFSRKIQVKQYEPADVFCAITAEVGEGESTYEISQKLDAMVQEEVMKSINKLRPNLFAVEGVDTKKSEDVGLDDAENDVEIQEA